MLITASIFARLDKTPSKHLGCFFIPRHKVCFSKFQSKIVDSWSPSFCQTRLSQMDLEGEAKDRFLSHALAYAWHAHGLHTGGEMNNATVLRS
jgi:hypothetical protein